MKFSLIHTLIAVLLFLIIGFLGGLWFIEPRTQTSHLELNQ